MGGVNAKWPVLTLVAAGAVLAVWMNVSTPQTHQGMGAPPHGLRSLFLPEIGRCAAGGYAGAAARNAGTLHSLSWAPFRRAELGWETYVPLIAHEIGSTCSPTSSGFASALARWQRSHHLRDSGEFDAAVFARMNGVWQLVRPLAMRGAGCPAPADESTLANGRPGEGYSGKPVQLTPDAFAAYRRLVRDARAEDPAIRADPRYLTIVSAYRSPAHDAERCATENNCEGIVRARCSVHSTGRAIDFYVGEAPGYDPTSTADPNRLVMSRSPAYLWLVANARNYGFIPYPFEPWHWEWVGDGYQSW